MSTEIHGQDLQQISEDFPTAPAPQNFSPSQSPTPIKAKGERFGDVIVALTNGLKVRRQCWPEGEYVFVRNGNVGIRRGGRDYDFFELRVEDQNNADDWVVVE